jgi:hypothetical protein
MYFLAAGTITKPTEIAQYVDQENDVLNRLRAEGIVEMAFRYAAKHGVVGIFQNASLAGLQSDIERLPFVRRGLMTFTYEEIIEL